MRRRFGSTAAVLVGVAIIIALAACKANDGADTRSRATTTTANTATTNTATAAPNAPATTQAPQVDETRRITVAELQAALEKGEAVVVDVRNEQSYKAGHIKGARWIYESDVPARANELPRDKLIVTYCA